MALKRIRILDLRIIEKMEFEPTPRVNLVWGANGSGKTSVLEAIYLLGRGRSFRASRINPVIREGSKCVSVIGWKEGKGETVAGIRRCACESEIRINGEKVTKLSDLARLFPVQVMTPRSHELIERGPELRRRFLDWGVFHVEQSYPLVSARYHRVLRQRNEALRLSPGEEKIWEGQLVELASTLTAMREAYVPRLQTSFDRVLASLGFETPIRLALQQGWPANQDLAQVLNDKRAHDRKQGFTGYGPHRADLTVIVGKRRASDRLSRGQQKLVVLALSVAELELVGKISAEKPILLVDDIGAELDSTATERVYELLCNQPGQVFVTALEEKMATRLDASGVFHVEQGILSS